MLSLCPIHGTVLPVFSRGFACSIWLSVLGRNTQIHLPLSPLTVRFRTPGFPNRVDNTLMTPLNGIVDFGLNETQDIPNLLALQHISQLESALFLWY